MNNKALTLSILMAVIAVFFVQSYVGSIEEAARKKFGTQVMVLTAARDIKEMETINETLLTFKAVPKNFLEPSAIAFKDMSQDATKGKRALAGTIALVPIKKGEQITYNKITDPGLRTGLSPQITPGKRAVAVPVNETSGVGKLVKPGDRVDLIAVLDAGSGKASKIAKTLLQDVVVLAVGRSITNNVPRIVEADPFGGKNRVKSLAEDFSFATVTLEVDPAQAQELAMVMANGDTSVFLSLRNNDDTARGQFGSTSLMDLLGPDAAKVMRGLAGRR